MTLKTKQLAELIHQKHQVLEQLHMIAVRQGELVETGDMPPLLKLLAAKQRLLDGLRSLEKRLEPFHAENPETRTWESAEARAACSKEAADCNQLLEAVRRLELVHEKQMLERRDAVSLQLNRAHTAHQAADAYQTHRRPSTANVASQPVVTPVEVENPSAGIDLSTGQ